MKNLRLIILLVLCSSNIFAVCETEPTIETTGKILKELKVKKSLAGTGDKSAEAEIGLFIKASVKNSSWKIKGSEAAVLTVFVDGKYNQDVLLFAGRETFEYQMLLGKFDRTDHRVTIVLNQKHSAPNAMNVNIQKTFTTVFDDLLSKSGAANRLIPAYIATLNAPVIYLRPDTINKFSDIPLLTYYEIFDEPENIKRIRYTTIFTNEDGGTRSRALMARWGRMTDIEWIYEIRVRASGEILSEVYQAANHETKNFLGQRLGDHPLFLDATVNNNFADMGCSALRVSPMLVQADLSNVSRETIMDKAAWTYRIMAEEALRENRIVPHQLGENAIDELQNYLYVEVYSENENAAVAVEAETFDRKTSVSDYADSGLRVDRNGYKRIALRMPSLESPLKSLNLICSATKNNQPSAVCRNARIIKFVRLDKNFKPSEIINPRNESRSLKPNERLTWMMSN